MKLTYLQDPYWVRVGKEFLRHRLGVLACIVIVLFCLVAIYAPFLASSKPIAVKYDGNWYFPLFRYLFFPGFYTKKLDIFFNLLMFTAPFMLICFWLFRRYPYLSYVSLVALILLQFILFFYFSFGKRQDPAANPLLNEKRQVRIQQKVQEKKNDWLIPTPPIQGWDFDLKYMNDYAKLNLIVADILRRKENATMSHYLPKNISTAWGEELKRQQAHQKVLEQKVKAGSTNYEKAFQEITQYIESCLSIKKVTPFEKSCFLLSTVPENEKKKISEARQVMLEYQNAKEALRFINERKNWLVEQEKKITLMWMPLIRPFHWEDDAGGSQTTNQYLPWWELTRVNGKDLVAALLFGTRISLVVGILAVSLAVIIGVPIGCYAGYYGGRFDIFVSRLLEIWESMPTFFMLLLAVGILQSKSIFLVIAVIGFFGWTGFSRYIRGEFFKQRNLAYVEACHSLGFKDSYIIFSHILPNALPPLLTLLPFAIMSAITSEAGLSFLGLGEEESCSWGVLMDEGRSAFPAEAYLLWPPAILLTVLLVSIALVGDALRDALDPKMRQIR